MDLNNALTVAPEPVDVRPSRRPLPDHLPREDVVHPPALGGGLQLPRLRRRHAAAGRGQLAGAGVRTSKRQAGPASAAEAGLPALRADRAS